MTKTERIVVSTEAGRGLRTERITPKLTRWILPNKDQVIFWAEAPFAVYDGSYVYYLTDVATSRTAALNKYWAGVPRISLSINDFEYTIGQALSKAGLMLVRRLDP